MKKTIKILIVLITIFMMSSGLIKNNVVFGTGQQNDDIQMYDKNYIENMVKKFEKIKERKDLDKDQKEEAQKIYNAWWTASLEASQSGAGEAQVKNSDKKATDDFISKYDTNNSNSNNLNKDSTKNTEKSSNSKSNTESANTQKQSDIKQFSQSEVIRITDQMQKQIDKLKNENKDYSTLQDIKNEWDEKWNLNGKTTADISPELYSKTQAELNKYGVDITKSENKNGDSTDDTDEDAAEDENDGLGTPGPLKLLTTALDGVVGILFLLPKTIFLISLYTVGQVINLAAGGEFSIESIIFNQAVDHPVEIISIDFFDSNGDSKGNTKALIQQNIATWYVAIRNIAITILVIVAMYIAIRMLLATTSEKKAQYKEILIYWVQSLALIFVLHYIMIGIIAINDALVKSLYKAGEEVITGKNNNIMETLFSNAFSAIKITTSLANTFAYMVLCFVTIMFFISYLKRMMTIAFLITIAPLVTITYSIDKIGDGKSQALNAWLKEFSYTILIQPFHCITYLALGSIGTQLLERNDSFGDIFIGLYFLSFILQSENIVRGIFGIQPSTMKNVIGEMSLVAAVAGKFSGAGKSGIQYTGDSKANRFMGGAERSGGQKRTPNTNTQRPTTRPSQSQSSATNPQQTSQSRPSSNPQQTPSPTPRPSSSQNTSSNSQQTSSSTSNVSQNSQQGQSTNTQSTSGANNQSSQGANTTTTRQSNWYDHYNVDDARREELNNKPNRTVAENNELNDINNKAMRNMRRRRTIRRAANGYVGLSMGVAGAMAKMALAVASGDGKAMIAEGFSAKDSIKNNMDKAVERATRGDMIDAYKLARKVSPDKDDKYFKDLAKGKISAANEQEQEFVDSLSKHQNIMDKHGKIDDKHLDDQTDALLDNINSGDLDQHNALYRAGRWIGRRKSN
ncbi:MAG: hypothetical protein HXK67_01365 [Clostridiales bacterium]|nr:hypothetical protein [Clostridiales bacterium]